MSLLKVAKLDPEADVRKILGLAFQSSAVLEIRIIGGSFPGDYRPRMISGYFDNADTCVAELNRLESWTGIYFTPNPVNPICLARAENRLYVPSKESCTTDAEIVRRHWFLVDVDYERPAGISTSDIEHRECLDKCQEIAVHMMEQGWTEPVLADSGNGGHLMFRIDEPSQDNGLISECLEALDFKFGTSKLNVDGSCSNPARIWKLYGTLTRKGDNTTQRPHRHARLIHTPDICHITPTSKLKALARLKPQKASQATAAPTEGFDLGEWLKDHSIEARGPHHKSIHGDTAQLWTLDTCAWNAAHTDGAAFVMQYDKSGKMAAGCHHNGCKGKKWHDLRVAYEPDYKARMETGQSLDKLGSLIQDSRDDGNSYQYTEEELSDIATAQNTAPEDIAWFVLSGQDIYFRTRHGYDQVKSPYLHQEVIKHLHAVPRAEIYDLATRPGQPPKPKTLTDLLVAHSVRTRGAVLSFIADKTSFNRKTREITVAVAPRDTELQPRHDPKIEKYLALLAGDQYPRLLKYLETFLDLHLPTAALYLHGPGGCGKSEIFSKGLARLWKCGQPTSINQALGRFNDKVLRCPLILADEGIPENPEFPNLFRSWTSGGSHEIEAKYAGTIDLEGCPRIIITSNEADFSIGGSHGADSHKALNERVLSIEVSEKSREYLEDASLVTVEEKHGWINGGLAAHVLYLIQNRKEPKIEGRFLVRGNLGSQEGSSVLYDRVTSKILELICKIVQENGQSIKNCHGTNQDTVDRILFEKGHLYANSSGIGTLWENMSTREPPPTTSAIGRALKVLSLSGDQGKRIKRKGVNLYPLDVERIAAWSDEHYLAKEAFKVAIVKIFGTSEEGE